MEGFAQLLPIIAIFALFWFLIIRPQVKRHRELRNLQQSVSVGDEVMLSAGLFGTVRQVGTDVADQVGAAAHAEDRILVEVAPGVVVTVARAAIGQIVEPQGQPGHEEL